MDAEGPKYAEYRVPAGLVAEMAAVAAGNSTAEGVNKLTAAVRVLVRMKNKNTVAVMYWRLREAHDQATAAQGREDLNELLGLCRLLLDDGERATEGELTLLEQLAAHPHGRRWSEFGGGSMGSKAALVRHRYVVSGRNGLIRISAWGRYKLAQAKADDSSMEG